MARGFLLAAGALWLVLGLAGVAVSLGGIAAIEAVLPPLAIGRDALARTVAALGIGALLVGMAHVVIVRGLARGRSWGPSAGILLAGVSVAGFVALAAAAATAGAAGTMAVAPSVLGTAGALLAALVYGAAGAALAHRLSAGPPL